MEATPSAGKRLTGLDRWLVFFVVFGLGLRIFRYALGLPIWVDEGFLGVNILDRGYRALLAPMEYIQVAPLGFLWAERGLYQLFGMSEYVMRLISTVAGTGGLILFAVWARRVIDPLATTVAVAVLAVSDLAVRHAVELKPYGIDLLAGVVLLWLATNFFIERKSGWLWWLIVATPAALFFSLPAVFVLAGIATTLLVDFFRSTRREKLLIAIFILVLCGAFGGLVWGFIGRQLAGTGPSQQVCWVFPPLAANPLKFLAWFWQTHSGNYFGYPLDFSSPGSAPSFLVMVVGAVMLFRSNRKLLGMLLISPFVMTFLAAMLRLYPYGDSPRVGQHLVGPICLLIGAGSAAIIRWIGRSERGIRGLSVAVFAVLIVIGLIAPVMLVVSPSTEVRRDLTVREFVREQMAGIPPETTIAVVEKSELFDILARWYVHEGSHRLVYGVPIEKLTQLTRGPLLIVSAPIDLDGLDQRIAHQMRAQPIREARLPVPGQVSYLMMYYAKG
jgi:hypothetical protein